MFLNKYLFLLLCLISMVRITQAQEVPTIDTSGILNPAVINEAPPAYLDQDGGASPAPPPPASLAQDGAPPPTEAPPIDELPSGVEGEEDPSFPITSVTTVDSQYNLLQVSGSPAGDLLGLTPGLIQTPSDPTNFLVRVANTTQNFTILPAFGMDVSPAWIYGGSKIKYEDFSSNQLFDNIWQTLTLSAAVNSTNFPDTFTQLAGGIKFSLLRGKLPKKIGALYDASSRILSGQISSVDAQNRAAAQDTIYQSYLQQMKRLAEAGKENTKAYKQLQEKAESRLSLQTAANTPTQDLDSLATIASQVNFTRYGFKCELAAGASANYLNSLYENGELGNIGVWLTAGYETQGGFSVMGQGKYLHHNLMDADTLLGPTYSSFDTGAKLNFPNPKGNFSFSIEAVYRQPLGEAKMPPSTWGYTATVNYKLPPTSATVPSTILSFSFGRGFNGDITGAQPIVAAMHFFKGFGAARPISH